MTVDNTGFLLAVLFAHWLADFVFQSDKMAKSKSSSWEWLTAHVLEYITVTTVVLFVYMGIAATVVKGTNVFPFGPATLGIWILINGGAHFVIDAVTSRISSYYYKKGRTHAFWVVIGFDQFLHLATFVITAEWMLLYA